MDWNWNPFLTAILEHMPDAQVLRHFLGAPLFLAPPPLNEAAILCLDMEWWQKEPKPTTELGIAELTQKGYLHANTTSILQKLADLATSIAFSEHVENILTGIRVAHARIMSHAHLRNNFVGAGDPEQFLFGESRFVTQEQAKQVLIDTFVRKRQYMNSNDLQPIILVGHAVGNEFEHLKEALGVDLKAYGTIIKVIDTQVMAKEAGIQGPKGPLIGLGDLLAYFNITVPNLHTAGNDAAATLIVAVLLAMKDNLYGPSQKKPLAMVRGRHVQDVVERVMAIGKSQDPPSWGISRFCTKCGRKNHFRVDCYATVMCSICRNSGVIRLYNTAWTHDTSKCLYNHQDLPPRDHGPGWLRPSLQ